jgi:hypothetical protein
MAGSQAIGAIWADPNWSQVAPSPEPMPLALAEPRPISAKRQSNVAPSPHRSPHGEGHKNPLECALLPVASGLGVLPTLTRGRLCDASARTAARRPNLACRHEWHPRFRPSAPPHVPLPSLGLLHLCGEGADRGRGERKGVSGNGAVRSEVRPARPAEAHDHLVAEDELKVGQLVFEALLLCQQPGVCHGTRRERSPQTCAAAVQQVGWVAGGGRRAAYIRRRAPLPAA